MCEEKELKQRQPRQKRKEDEDQEKSENEDKDDAAKAGKLSTIENHMLTIIKSLKKLYQKTQHEATKDEEREKLKKDGACAV